MRIRVTVNNTIYERDIEENRTLLRFLREDLGLTGTKEGCGSGECGACTVFFNGKTVNSCMVLAAEADGSVIETIEGEASGGMLSALQKAFEEHGAVQCGFCTAGMIMSARELIHQHPHPTRAEIQEGLEGNFCRCTGYEQIIEAVLDVTGGYEPKEELSYV
ncbi:MAG TPA: (2Fe-2S)-binding protein [Sphaerochaeta sp.]|jgi:carbon-monoxide dehydrogenase small subunit|nr:(2Fe-2S)-binding protein [Sphaerochaeta sp.]